MEFEDIGLKVPEVLLPVDNVDMRTWSVIACDQFTSQPEYWEKVKGLVGNNPSTLNLIFPEVYLDREDSDRILKSIHENMHKYLDNGVMKKIQPGFILVDRKTPHTRSRKGLVVALDLEKYDFTRASETLIRATEGTVEDRLPPRIKVRKGSALELPHIMVLIDDPDETVIEPLFELDFKKIYDFDLMMDSGHIKGYHVGNHDVISRIAENISKLAEPGTFRKKYGSATGPLLYAVGDGNHSLATAKAVWEDIKQHTADKSSVMAHPARHALVELVNLHDKGLQFEPIHRVVFNINPDVILENMKAFFASTGSDMSIRFYSSVEECIDKTDRADHDENMHIFSFTASTGCGVINIKQPRFNLAVGALQEFLDIYMAKHPDTRIDYIHGKDAVEGIGNLPGNMGFFLPPMSKHDLFKTVILDGELPRKTFSMGEAEEKRFYVECRKIIP